MLAVLLNQSVQIYPKSERNFVQVIFAQTLSHYHALEIGKKLFDPSVTTVIKDTEEDIVKSWRIFQRYHDKGFSFIDCTSFAIMERLKITTAFAFDDHFAQYGKFIVVP